ncbi:methyl-accepting chemotaxis protein [Glaciecola siphonariae]|uniref:Methyl-accepting chemotaxis protein n=1 Tax=Glaciecola siphonariae TaxID=521012 RepID=A0ABV9LQY0_9ALTE
MTLKLRLMLSMIVIALTCILLLSASSLTVLVNVSTHALTESARDNLTSKLVNTTQAVETYIDTLESQLRVKSQEPAWVEAMQAFVPAFNKYSAQRTSLTQSEVASLEQYYTRDFSALYESRNDKKLSQTDRLYKNLSANSLALQHDFIASSSFDIGSKDGLVRLPNATDYANLHAQFHPSARRFLKEFGYYDIFLVDAPTGHVVYSVFKELDYATSIKTGPYANTGIAEAYKLALEATSSDEVFFSNLNTYLPSYDAMAGFLSSAIFDGDRVIGVLIFQIPLDRLNTVLTRNSDWIDQGYGLSGETYMVGNNKKIITESRFFLENPTAYYEALSQKSPQVAKNVKSAGTTVGIQPVNTETVQAALNGQAGFTEITDYRGVPVFSAYAPISIGNYDYAVIAEMDVEEALALASDIQSSFIYTVLIVGLVVLLIAGCISVYLIVRITKPLHFVGKMCHDLSAGTGDLTIRLRECGIPEIDRLLVSFNTFIIQVHDIVSTIRENSHALASASEELSAITVESQRNASEQRTQTDSVSEAVEELSQSISSISDTVQNNLAQSEAAKETLANNMDKTDIAANNIRNLVMLIKESSNVIASLRGEVSQVTEFLEVITSIADQTNLLALNAAIEAARAGDAGRGFSVVADEVRTLATRSQENTEKISLIVDKMTKSSDDSVTAMDKAVSAADKGIDLVETVTNALNTLARTLEENQALANTVAHATAQQQQSSGQVAHSVSRISDAAHDAETGASQTNQAAQELASIAAKTMDMVSRFKV